MPKDTTGTFFNDENNSQKSSSDTSPDTMGKWVGVAEKGINLVQQLINMRQAGQSKGGGETSAYEKGLSQGMAQAPAPQPIIQEVIKPATIKYKSEEAEKYLFEALGKVNQEKTLKEYIEGDLKEAQEMGVLKPMLEQFLKNFTEVEQ